MAGMDYEDSRRKRLDGSQGKLAGSYCCLQVDASLGRKLEDLGTQYVCVYVTVQGWDGFALG